MLRIVKAAVIALPLATVGTLLHYALPQTDIVRVSSTEVVRMDFTALSRHFYASADSAMTAGATRDIRLINAARPNGRVIVYRNEDTSFGWPFYFKLDSSNLQAEAADSVSAKGEKAEYVAITHYGWRIPPLSIYPNAVSLKPVSGPDAKTVPVFNLVFFTLLGAALFGLWTAWRRFRRARIDPTLARMGESIDAARDGLDNQGRGARAWLDTWKGKPRT